MSISQSSTGLLECLPGISGGDVGLYLVDASGVLIQHFGFDDELDTAALATDVEGALAPDRRADERTMGSEGERVVVTFPRRLAGFDTFLDYLFLTLSEKDQLELDMESMYSSSLALLEELSVVSDVMGRLSIAKTEGVLNMIVPFGWFSRPWKSWFGAMQRMTKGLGRRLPAIVVCSAYSSHASRCTGRSPSSPRISPIASCIRLCSTVYLPL